MEDSIEQFKKNFYDHYHNHLIADLEQFEKKRIGILRKAILQTTILIIIGILLPFIEFKFFYNDTGYTEQLSFALIVIGCLSYYVHKKGFEHKIKNQIMPSVCSCFGNFTWSMDYRWHEIFEDAGIIKEYMSACEDDVFIGKYKNVRIDIIEAQYKNGFKKDGDTIFDGVIIRLNMNKNYTGHTILTKDKLFHTSPLRHLKHTELEDVDFEKKYDVFTDDPIEARCLLTPAFMEKVKNIRVAFHSKNMKCAFYQNNLIISIETGSKDLFSIGSLFRPVADPKQFEELLKQFVSILELIDILDLDKKVVL